METKSLLIGIISFIAGALLVSTAAVTFNKPEINIHSSDTSMTAMIEGLKDKSGDDYDKEFLSHMIVHHEGAIDMAKLSPGRAKHDEIKKLSQEIIADQEKEISEMKKWQSEWGYNTSIPSHHGYN